MVVGSTYVGEGLLFGAVQNRRRIKGAVPGF